MSWIKRDVVGPIPDELASVSAEASTLVSTLTPILTSVANLLSAAQVFYTTTLDPYSSLVTSLINQAENLNNDFFATGVYDLSVTPFSRSGVTRYDSFGFPLMTPKEAILSAVESFDDLGDSQRPQFSNSAQVSAIGLLASAPSPDAFISIVENLTSILQLEDWKLLLKLRERHSDVSSVESVLPDWRSLKLNSIEDMRKVQDSNNQIISYARGYAATPDTNIQDLVDVINAKVSKLNQLKSQLDQLTQNLRAATGVFVMNVPMGVGGNERIKQELRDCPLERSTNQYTVLTVIMGGGPSLSTVDNFRKLVL